MTLDDYLIHLSEQGLEERLEKLYPDPEVRAQERPRYDERLKIECDTIVQMGFLATS